jgi:hypothetical protein
LTPLTELRWYRDLRERRPELIRAAREAGHTWEEIAEASGLSRAQVFKLAAKVDRE